MSHTTTTNDLRNTPPQAATPTLNGLSTRASAHTHVGRVRETNEDQFLVGDVTSAIQVTDASMLPSRLYLGSSPLSLLIVADGMGGHAAGERASALAVSSVEGFILRALGHIGSLGMRDPVELLEAGFRVADDAVIEAAQRQESTVGMGTTMTVALVIGTEAHIAHAGDSRAYLFRDGALSRLTRDHTLAEAINDRQLIDTTEVADESSKHILTNSVGGGTPGVRPDVTRVDLRAGDQLLLCTDGLTNMADDDTIAGILAKPGDPSDASKRLIDAALAGGGEDNVTALVALFDAS